MSKSQLRLLFRAKRSHLSSNERLLAAQNAAEILQKQSVFTHSKHIACYLPFKDEFDTLPIIQAIWQANKKCYLPVLSEPEENSLFFVAYTNETSLHINRYAIREPNDISKIIAANELDLVIMPLVAFDRAGYRLGMGGGYYDRTFAFLQERSSSKLPHLLGLGFAIQESDEIPAEKWDVKLNSILTEKEFIVVSSC